MSKAARQRTARERLAEERKRQAQREKQRRALLISLSGLVVLAVVVTIGVYVATKKEARTQKATAYNGPLAPLSREADGSIVMAAAGVTAPLLEVFEDFQCPYCKDMETASGSIMKRLAAEGKVKVVYRSFQLFQGGVTGDNSHRAANAALCVPADKWVSYHDTIYKYQPAEGSKGFSTKDLIAWGADLGVTDAAFGKCVTDVQKASQLDQLDKYVTGRGVKGTPTVFLDGKSLDFSSQLMNPTVLETAILAAAKTSSPAASPPSSPSATASASPKQ